MQVRLVRWVIPVASGSVVAVTAYRRWFVPWQQNWGTTADERMKPLPGDQYVSDPEYETTRSITIDAPPEDLFPWLVQMGYRRGGLYSYDFLDRLFGILDAPSSQRIVPEWQGLQVGDSIPLGRGNPFPVAELEKNRWLVLAGSTQDVRWTWTMVLEPTEDGRLRFITRNRGSGMGSRLAMTLLDLAAFIMVRRWLIVLKGRAEHTARERRNRGSENWDALEPEPDLVHA